MSKISNVYCRKIAAEVQPFQEFVNLRANFPNSNLGQRNGFNGMI